MAFAPSVSVANSSPPTDGVDWPHSISKRFVAVSRAGGIDRPHTIVIIFRCTRTLLDRLPNTQTSTPARSTTALGDWYFKLLFTRPEWLLLGVSERSRLPVVLPARELRTMTTRFPDAACRIFEDLGVSASVIALERAAMKDVAFGKTVDRRVIGSLNDFAHAVKWALQDASDPSLHALSLRLAETPILPLNDFPDRMTRRLLEARTLH